MQKCIKLGVAATRRNLFSRSDAIKHKNLILQRLKDEKIDFVDIEWLNEDGLLYDVCFVDKVYDYFKEQKVDALFVPHCNFGCEEAVCNLAKKLNVPVLLWGPRDEAPLPDGLRLRDSQCGMFATSKVLQRFGVPFTYMVNSWVSGNEWIDGLKKFLRTASVVKAFRNMKIGQIDTRPRDFFSVICNESELLEKFGIQIIPTSLSEIVGAVKKKLDNPACLEKTIQYIKSVYTYTFDEAYIAKLAAMTDALCDFADANQLSAIAVQCWNALQDELGISTCVCNAILTDAGLPVACETDINGAVSAVMAAAATNWEKPIFFADITVRHPTNDRAELLWHCGPFPASLRKEGEKALVSPHTTLPSGCPGACEYELRHDEVTVVRFDGLHGEYSLLAVKGKGVDGPKSRGTYVWVEFPDWEAIETKLMYGPYIHHVAGIFGDVMPVLEDALRYIPGIKKDFM